jgi:hypothetical protein
MLQSPAFTSDRERPVPIGYETVGYRTSLLKDLYLLETAPWSVIS